MSVASLSVSDAASMAGVSIESMVNKINRGELAQTEKGIEIRELIRVYPNLKPLASIKIRKVKKRAEYIAASESISSSTSASISSRASASTFEQSIGADVTSSTGSSNAVASAENSAPTIKKTRQRSAKNSGTVELLVRELEWNKALLEQTNERMAKQLAEQRALIADQARRLDEKDRFWARQIEIAQSLLPAPETAAPRKKLFGIF